MELVTRVQILDEAILYFCLGGGKLGIQTSFISVGNHLPFQHNELFHLPYMAVVEIGLGRVSLQVRPEEPFLLLKYIITLSLILYSYYWQSLS